MFIPPIAISTIDYVSWEVLPREICEYQLVTPDYETQNRKWPSPRPTSSVVSSQRDLSRNASFVQLYEISKLLPNWDGYGADPVDSASVDRAATILLALPSRIPSPEITPNPNGTISLDWECAEQAVSLEVGVARYSAFWESEHGLRTDQGDLTDGLPQFVAWALAYLFPESTPVHPGYVELASDTQERYGYVAAGRIG
ncbi:MAG: hypothetical protein WBG92_15245 [Thiohalocapsa sp.]